MLGAWLSAHLIGFSDIAVAAPRGHIRTLHLTREHNTSYPQEIEQQGNLGERERERESDWVHLTYSPLATSCSSQVKTEKWLISSLLYGSEGGCEGEEEETEEEYSYKGIAEHSVH